MKTIKNYLYNLTFQLLSIILPVITTPYISRVLQVEGVGRYSLSHAVTNYFILFGLFGFATYGNREIAYVRNDEDEKVQTFWEINNTRFITMGMSMALYIAYVLFAVVPQWRFLYCAQAFTLAAAWIDISWYFTGIEEFRKIATRNIAVKIISAILIFTFVKSKSDLGLYALIIAGSTFIGSLVLWKDIDFKHRFQWRKTRQGKTIWHLKRTMGLWVPALAINIFTYLDKIMLGFLCDEIQVGLYESSDKIARMAVTAVTAFSAVMVPKTSNLYVNRQMDEFEKNINISLSFVMIISIPMTFGIMGISGTLVPWFLGAGYEEVKYLLLISAWLAITLGLSSILGNAVLISLNKEKEYTFAVVTAAILNVLLNIILIPKFQAYGALVATVAAEYTNMIIMMICARKYYDKAAFWGELSKYMLAGAIMGIAIYGLGSRLPASAVTTFIQVIVGIIIYFALLSVIKDKNLTVFLEMIKGKGGQNE